MIWWFFLFLVAVLALVWYTRKLTTAGVLVAGLLAVLIYGGTGMPGILLLGTFFATGVLVTAWQKPGKIAMGVADARSSQRSAGQVLANGGIAALLGLLAWLIPHQRDALLLMLAGAFAAATADTVSSELGVLYGKRMINIRTFRPDKRGLDGVISLEGTLLGMAGAALIGLVLWLSGGPQAVLPVVIAGTAGNLADSWLGATFEGEGRLTNDWVNTCNTATGALAAACWAW